jgi:multidrug resistance efflux pump
MQQTSCLGKKQLRKVAADLAKEEAEIEAYQAAIAQRKRRIEREAEQVRDVHSRFNQAFTLNEKGMVSIRAFVEKLGVYEVCEAMELAHSKARRGQEFKYFCGICWNKIREKDAD